MSYIEVKLLIKRAYSGSGNPFSAGTVALRINATRDVARKALDSLCSDGFCKKEGNSYRVTSS